MVFGSAGSDWGFNRAADALNWAAQQLLHSLRYVDDFGGVEPRQTADSGCDAFERFFSTLDFQMKASKVQQAASQQQLLGVIITVTDTGIVISPSPNRVQRLEATIQRVLQLGELPPSDAAQIAGKK